MKNILVIVVVAMFLTSCATYKGSQTPDDVYYSPARNIGEKETSYYSNTSQDDWYLLMKARNNNLWNSLDDYSYWYDSRYSFNSYNYNYYYNSVGIGYRPTYSNFYGWSYYYSSGYNNPFCGVIYYKNPTAYYGSTNASNISAYKNRTYNNGNSTSRPSSSYTGKTPYPTNTNNSYSTPARAVNSTPSSNAGGRSGGFNSSGSSASSGRSGRGG
jgi:hypothetical protein